MGDFPLSKRTGISQFVRYERSKPGLIDDAHARFSRVPRWISSSTQRHERFARRRPPIQISRTIEYERGSAEEETATRANGATMIEVVSRYLARTIIVAGCPGGLLHSTRSLGRPRRFRFASVLRHRRLAPSSVFKIGANGIYAAIATVKR